MRPHPSGGQCVTNALDGVVTIAILLGHMMCAQLCGDQAAAPHTVQQLMLIDVCQLSASMYR